MKLDEPEPIVTEEAVTVVKHTSYSLKFDAPKKVKNIEKIKLDFVHYDKTIDSFEVDSPSEDKPVLVHKELEFVENEDSGVYTISMTYNRQKYIHKIALEVGTYNQPKYRKLFVERLIFRGG